MKTRISTMIDRYLEFWGGLNDINEIECFSDSGGVFLNVWFYDGSIQIFSVLDNSIRSVYLLSSKKHILGNEISIRLKTMMLENDIDQIDLSIATGISRSTIGRYINVNTIPTISNLIKISEALNCDISTFILSK